MALIGIFLDDPIPKFGIEILSKRTRIEFFGCLKTLYMLFFLPNCDALAG